MRKALPVMPLIEHFWQRVTAAKLIEDSLLDFPFLEGYHHVLSKPMPSENDHLQK